MMWRDRSKIKTYQNQNHVLVPGHGDGTSRWIGQNRHQSWSSGNEWGWEQSLEQMIFVLRELKDMVFCCVFAQVLDFSVALLFLSILLSFLCCFWLLCDLFRLSLDSLRITFTCKSWTFKALCTKRAAAFSLPKNWTVMLTIGNLHGRISSNVEFTVLDDEANMLSVIATHDSHTVSDKPTQKMKPLLGVCQLVFAGGLAVCQIVQLDTLRLRLGAPIMWKPDGCAVPERDRVDL